jgi:hypothetical protein
VAKGFNNDRFEMVLFRNPQFRKPQFTPPSEIPPSRWSESPAPLRACHQQAPSLRIPAMPITHSDLMAITIPSDADHRRSEATLAVLIMPK